MARSPRAAARRRVLKDLADIKRRLSRLQNWWGVESWIYVAPADRPPGSNVYRRERLPGEYPEARRSHWLGTIQEVDALVVSLGELREHALNEYHATPDGKA